MSARAALLVAAGAVLGGGAGSASAAGLAPLPGRAACFEYDVPEHRCTPLHSRSTSTAGVEGIAVARDGRSVYAVDSTLLGFRRNRRTGRLAQIRVPRVGGTVDVAVAPSGRTVYVSTTRGVAVLRRSPASGRLRVVERERDAPAGLLAVTPDGRQLLDGFLTLEAFDVGAGGRLHPAACHPTAQSAPSGCDGTPLSQTLEIDGLAVGAGGTRVYSIAGRDDVGQLVAYARDPATGGIEPAACAGDTPQGAPDCAAARSLDGPGDLAVAPDGAGVYVAAANVEAPEGGALIFRTSAVAAFAADPFAQLAGRAGCALYAGRRKLDCAPARRFRGMQAVAVAPNGRHVLAAAFFSGALVLLARDRTTQALTRVKGRGGCLADRSATVLYPARRGCRTTIGMADPARIAISPDSRHAYVATETGLAALRLR